MEGEELKVYLLLYRENTDLLVSVFREKQQLAKQEPGHYQVKQGDYSLK